MTKRPHINKDTKLAAALLTIRRENESGELVPVIPYEESKTMTAKQIISRFALDHYPVRHADGGPSLPWNLFWRPRPEHDKKTREIDVPQIAKQKRIRGETGNGPRAKIPSRPNAWGKGRKIPSRGFPKQIST